MPLTFFAFGINPTFICQVLAQHYAKLYSRYRRNVHQAKAATIAFKQMVKYQRLAANFNQLN